MSISRSPSSIAYNTDLADLIGRYVELRRVGNNLMGCCPFHDDRNPSLSVSNFEGASVDMYYCFACGAKGDAIEFLKQYHGISFIEALECLGGEPTVPVHDLPRRPVSKPDKMKWVNRIWESTDPLHLCEASASYLANRAIPAHELGDLENVRSAWLQYRGDGEEHPTIVAAVRDGGGDLIGIQRTYLTEEGTKLPVDDPKLSLGTLRGGAIKLGRATSEITICEGLEDGLSLRFGRPDATVWVAAGGRMMPQMPIPEDCSSVIIAQDNDDAGHDAAQAAAAAFRRPSRTIRIMKPSPQFKDFNAELMASVLV